MSGQVFGLLRSLAVFHVQRSCQEVVCRRMVVGQIPVYDNKKTMVSLLLSGARAKVHGEDRSAASWILTDRRSCDQICNPTTTHPKPCGVAAFCLHRFILSRIPCRMHLLSLSPESGWSLRNMSVSHVLPGKTRSAHPQLRSQRKSHHAWARLQVDCSTRVFFRGRKLTGTT